MTTLLLDGAMGTELERRGARMDAPLWSAHSLIEAPEVIVAIHTDYLLAGADVLTTNTFRTHARNLVAGGRQDDAAELTRRAVALAIGARHQLRRSQTRAASARIAGSISPLEDCFAPDRSPDFRAAFDEHREMANTLVQAEVDLLLVETMSRVDEAVAAATAASGLGVPVWLSVVGRRDGRMLGGETIEALLQALDQRNVQLEALLVNCTDIDEVEPVLAAMRTLLPAPSPTKLGAYPHTGRHDPLHGFVTHACDERAFADKLDHLRHRYDLDIVGSCCGSTPRWTATLRQRLDGPTLSVPVRP